MNLHIKHKTQLYNAVLYVSFALFEVDADFFLCLLSNDYSTPPKTLAARTKPHKPLQNMARFIEAGNKKE